MADANPHPTPLPTGANVHLIKNTTQATQAEVTVLFPGPCTCAIIQYLSPKLQTAITHSILNQFFSFLGCGLAFIQTRCMQIYRVCNALIKNAIFEKYQ